MGDQLLKRLTVVCTGSINAALLPWWMARLRVKRPEIEVRVVVTRSAAQFVSVDALSVITGIPAMLDVWPPSVVHAPHVELVEWSDAFAVYPATANVLARMAAGMTDTPSLLAMQCTTAPIAVAPALPEGALEHPTMRRNLAVLSGVDNIVLVEPSPGRSWSTGRDGARIPPAFPLVVQGLEDRLGSRAGKDTA